MQTNCFNKKVFYHGSCHDGTAAAAVFKLKYPDAEFIPVKGKNDEDALKEAKKISSKDCVYFLDNSFLVEEVIDKAGEIIIIDHHESEKDRLTKLSDSGKIKYFFDNNESGATLTWKLLFPDEKLPKFLEHIRDIDLWLEEDKKSDNVALYAFLYLDDIDRFAEFIEEKETIEEIYKKGDLLKKYRDKIVDYYLRNVNALHLRVGEHRIKVFNVASPRHIVSLIGHILSEKTKEAVGLFKVFGRNSVNISFRSTDKSRVPAIYFATKLGGGGHKNAAGASVTLEKFFSLLDESD